MELTELRKLVRLMLRADLAEVEIDDSNRGLRVHIKRGASGSGSEAAVAPVVQVMPSLGGAPPLAGHPVEAAGESMADRLEEGDVPPGTEVLSSPMVGTFYRGPAPDADPFVEVGSTVAEDTVLCIVEAMKVMNEIKAETKGVVVEILAENGEPVEFGQPLFLLKKH